MDIDYSQMHLEDGEDFGGLDDYDYDGYKYYNPDAMDSMDEMFEEGQMYQRISVSELADKCIIPTMTQALGAVFPLMAICFMSRLTHIFFAEGNYM